MNVKQGISLPKSRRSAHTTQSRRSLLLERLENRWLMAGNAGTAITDDVTPRNIGAVGVISFKFTEKENTTGRGLNDAQSTAEFLPLGTASGKQNTIDVTGSLALPSIGGLNGTLPQDVDYYAFDLRAGDILDMSGTGSIASIDVFFADGRRWFAAEDNQAALYPGSSPLMDTGNVVAAQVVPTTGRYFIRLGNNTSVNASTAYTLGLRVYRPVMEQAPMGTRQKIFLDFDGATISSSEFPASQENAAFPGTLRIPSLFDSLTLINLQPQDENNFINEVIAEVDKRFSTVGEARGLAEQPLNGLNPDGATRGGNGFYNLTGIAGQYGFEILNSRDHAEPINDPYTTKVVIGGSTDDINIDQILGISQSLDIGNFDPSEMVLLPIELFEEAATSVPLSNAKSIANAIAFRLATTIVHEVGHSVGLRHTDNANTTPSIIDTGGTALVQQNAMGVGPDGIFGTIDDIEPVFPVYDRFSPAEGFIGNQYVAASMAWAMSTGKAGLAGSPLTGRVFVDANRDGALTTGESGLAGVTVFNDANGNGVLDTGELRTTSAADGSFALAVGIGTQRVVAVNPNTANFRSSSNSKTVTVTGSGATANLGFSQLTNSPTGTKWADLNGDGIKDANEPGLSGVFIYLDLDEDGRIDIGEPRTVTDTNGNFTLTFPSPGTYRVREVVEPGYIQTAPGVAQNNEFVVVYNGTPVTDLNFGNLPSLDFGDLPDSFRTLVNSNGASHGLLQGLSIGAAPDRESTGVPTTGADGDNNSGVNDENDVVFSGPLFPGGTTSFSTTLFNTVGQTGYFRAWFDLNQNGQFETNELVVNDVTQTGLVTQSVTVPTTIDASKPLYARFRYSLTAGLSAVGPASAGEVEDYAFPLQATAGNAVPDFATITNDRSNLHFIDVLRNDFKPATGTIAVTSVQAVSDRGGAVSIARDDVTKAGIGVYYSPAAGFLGTDTFEYQVTYPNGQAFTAQVTVTVSFLSANPVAIDDSFDVAQGSSNIALNVLDNDLASLNGGVSIVSVTPGSQGGQASLSGGTQTIRYTPRAGFTGTEEFSYSIIDPAGRTSTAKVTVNLLPGSQSDDLAGFTIKFFDPVNNREITEPIAVGSIYEARVFVEDLRPVLPSDPDNQGVFSAYLDLLYDSELTSVVTGLGDGGLNFEIEFGNQFLKQGVATGSIDAPGIINEVGSTKPFDSPKTPNAGPIELFRVSMQAVAPGLAVFKSNPADLPQSETTLRDKQDFVTVAGLRLGTGQITIVPAGGEFTRAVDDSFLISVGSSGQPIPATLRVVDNDVLANSATVVSVTIAKQPAQGNAFVNLNNTISYTPSIGFSDSDSFTYTVLASDGTRSTATVNVTVGDAAANDQLEFALRFVDGNFNPITGPIQKGTRFGVQLVANDLRSISEASPLGVYAAFADILYNSSLVTPSNTIDGDDFNFDVVFSGNFGKMDLTGHIENAFGNANTRGIIDEFGSVLRGTDPRGVEALLEVSALVATIFFDAKEPGQVEFKTNPADALPKREPLLYTPATSLDPRRVRYGAASILINAPAGESVAARQNALLPSDVNDDGLVTPTDALLVINQIAAARRGEGETPSTSTSIARRFSDVSGDGRVTALDALQVINAIAANRRATPPVINTPPNVIPAMTQETFQRLSNLQTRMSKSFTGYVPVVVTGTLVNQNQGLGNGEGEGEEGYLDLLARDISTVIE